MKNLIRTETRIINFNGTIIVLTGEKLNSKRYAVRIDGVFSGHLEQKEDAFIPSLGSQIKPVLIKKICEVLEVGKSVNVN
ncbi:hypothetical protein [Pedobacter aquatilis]|uniref:hypothetical protein n=1 Tax=Pedobacter aquatilis TaxID=351343 RepID=UPI00293041E7|nr:hypothetical protein [Pedobacter aquatilis]